MADIRSAPGKMYVWQPPEVRAVQWDGDMPSAHEILELLRSRMGSAQITVEFGIVNRDDAMAKLAIERAFTVEGRNPYMRTGDWLLKHSDGSFTVLPDVVFQLDYKIKEQHEQEDR